MRTLISIGHAALPGGRILDDAAILVDGRRIRAVGPAAELGAAEHERHVQLPQGLALPGFVNAHQHGVPDSPAARGVPDQPLECWLVALTGLPVASAYEDANRTARRLVAAGVTTAVHAHFSPTVSATEYEQSLRDTLRGYADAGVRVVLAAELRDRGVPLYAETADFLANIPAEVGDLLGDLSGGRLAPEAALEVMDSVRLAIDRGECGDVMLALGPPGPPWCSDELLRLVAERAERWDMPVTTHLLETRYERLHADREYPGGGVERLGAAGLLSNRLLAAHGVWLDERDRAAMAAAGASVATNPSSNLRLHAGIAPVRELLEAGVNVSLGTDNLALHGTEDMFDELRLLVALHRRTEIADRGLQPAQALGLATRNGGRAVHRPDIGELAPGAMADIVVLDLEALRPPDISAQPLELALAVGRADALRLVMTGGRVVVETAGSSSPEGSPSASTEAYARRDAAALIADTARDHVQRWAQS